MESSAGKASKKPSMVRYLPGAKHRLLAAVAHRCGLVDKKRREKLAHGNPPWRILRYRRITRPEYEPYPLLPEMFVSPESFEAQMLFLVRNCNVISLANLIEKIGTGATIPDKTVVVTFDNGWRDNYHFAYPILRDYNIPACIFLATEFIGSMNMFWPDKVLTGMWLLEEAGVEFPPIPQLNQDPFSETTGKGASFGYRMARIVNVIEQLKRSMPRERASCLSTIGIGVDAIGGIPMERVFLDWNEIIEMAHNGITFGSNGHSHQVCKEMTAEWFRDDLHQSLLSMTSHEIPPEKAYAYPEGDITRDARKILCEYDIKYSLGLGDYSPSKDTSRSIVLGRVPIYEAATANIDMFACRLWGISILGHAY